KEDTGLISKIDDVLKEQERFEKILKDEISSNRTEINTSQKNAREELNSNLKIFGDSLIIKVSDLTQVTEQKLDKVNAIVEKKLEQMRETVDEKLHATLEKRFGESFKLVTNQLDLVQKGLGEMQTIAVGVGDLKKVLNNVKTRGTWGEAQLSNLLEEIL